ncbi:MAG: transglycosylase domain-containing protein [Chitinivibrionales bacterium]|nr:transglycosylase domain-containing protein [Chitinivibrionales bacterium]
MNIRKVFHYCIIGVADLGVCMVLCYAIASLAFNHYFENWGERLVALEKNDMLSKEFGAAWQDILSQDQMQNTAGDITNGSRLQMSKSYQKDDTDKEAMQFPSLSIVRRLNEVRSYSNTILITGRKGRKVATIRTDHNRAKIPDFPKTLLRSLLAAEDSRFYQNGFGFEFHSFVRAFSKAVFSSLCSFTKLQPRGTSTITQQVSKLFLSSIDESGQRTVSNSLKRKVQELRLSAALRKMYAPDEILEVYLNHCIASDYGLIGVKDIARGLFNKRLESLSDAECIYIARMVKWGRNVHSKISLQCHVDMPRMASALQWSARKQHEVLDQIDTMTFAKPRQIVAESGYLIDLANVFWLDYYRKNISSDSAAIAAMDLEEPSSLIRRKGNLTIKLTLDMPLQETLQRLVNSRGYGNDTLLYSDVRIGSFGEEVTRKSHPHDTLRSIRVLARADTFSAPGGMFSTHLKAGDTLVTNVRYAFLSPGVWRRSVFYYCRKRVQVEGQYFAYCIIEAQSGKLLAYYSRDKIGSRCAALLRNRTPNGSSTAKPIINALNFDMGNFKANQKWTDSLPVFADVAWKRYVIRKNGTPYEVVFENTSVPGIGYKVHNHNYKFEGCHYIFDQLNASNNILGVEALYRLNKQLFDADGNIVPDAYPQTQFLYRINAFDRIRDLLGTRVITGVRLYKELARIVGAEVDTLVCGGKKSGFSDSLYSVALGTLELTLLEQAHLFNIFNNNMLIERPIDHPSLVIDSITMNGIAHAIAPSDTVRRFHPFSGINAIRPTLLGLHKRLISNPADKLQRYDIAYTDSTKTAVQWYSAEALPIHEPVSNIAKSGTTDDVIRPFNVDENSEKRTNYGAWNATIRVDLSRLTKDTAADIHDITIACIGECNVKNTGPADGKTLHKFISAQLLKRIGVQCDHGFFSAYERYIRTTTPDSESGCNEFALSPVSATWQPPVEEKTEDAGDVW